jgi:hypothetical protein
MSSFIWSHVKDLFFSAYLESNNKYLYNQLLPPLLPHLRLCMSTLICSFTFNALSLYCVKPSKQDGVKIQEPLSTLTLRCELLISDRPTPWALLDNLQRVKLMRERHSQNAGLHSTIASFYIPLLFRECLTLGPLYFQNPSPCGFTLHKAEYGHCRIDMYNT